MSLQMIFEVQNVIKGVEAGVMESVGEQWNKMSESWRGKSQETYLQRGRPDPILVLRCIPQVHWSV